MDLFDSIVPHQKGEFSLCPYDRRSTKKVKIRIGDPILAERDDRSKDIPGDEDMVDLDDLEPFVEIEGANGLDSGF